MAQDDFVSRRQSPLTTLTLDTLTILLTASAICASIFLLYLPKRLWKLRSSRVNTPWNWVLLMKIVLGVSLSGFLLFHLLSAFNPSTQIRASFIVSMAISLIATLGLTLLLFIEHKCSFKPSDSGIVYLISSMSIDVILLTLPTEAMESRKFFRPVLGRFLHDLALLVLENLPKQEIPSTFKTRLSPEETRGVLSRTFFAWINPILLKGYRNILTNEDLPTLGRDIKPDITRQRMIRAWDKRAKPETVRTLPLALLDCVKGPFIIVILPRLFLIIFRYSQPSLIKQSIKYVTVPSEGANPSYGYWLVVSALTIYTGLAVSTAVYRHRLNRLKLVIRSALVGLIHHKTMNSPVSTYNDGNDGKAVSLMSTDVDSLDNMGEMFHETWAQVIEVLIGLALLAREVGWLWPLLIVLIFLCSCVSRYVARYLRPRQKNWNNATENRVAALSSMLSSMKVIKMLGFQDHVSDRIQQLRQVELLAASKVRWMMVYYNASANALGLFSPVIVLSLFAVIAGLHGDTLDTETAFTTIAILSMVTHPANMVMTIVPRAVAAFAGFDRIQTYLLRESLHDRRGTLAQSTTQSPSWSPTNSQLAKLSPAILIQDLTIGMSPPILKNLHIKMGSTRGFISLSTKRIGYCAQKPWLPNGSIKQAILGIFDDSDIVWYQQVIEACCLTEDFDSLPMGDAALIGSRGLNLSGGQRQRVALARALFSKCKVALLDDTFSGLDGKTEQVVVNNLFGTSGLFRQLGTTVVLVSNSSQYYHLSNQIIIIGEGGIREKGTWEELQGKVSAIVKFVPDSHTSGEDDTAQSENLVKLSAQLRATDEAEVDLSRQTGEFALYGYYLRFVGWVDFLLVVSCAASHSFFVTIPQYWLELWTEKKEAQLVWYYVGGFIILSLLSWTTTNGIAWSTHIRLAPRSGRQIHQHLMQIIVKAPLSYFAKTDNGSILNRFSQDIQLVDRKLPLVVSSVSVQIFKLLAQTVLLFTAQKWLSLSLPACMLVVYLIQKVYLRTSRQLRFLELESRAAVFSSFLETVEGIETLRSFGWRREAVQHNVAQLDHSQRPEFCLLSLQRWLNIVLDLLAASIATLVVAMAVVIRGQTTGGQVGVALNAVLLANTTLLKLVEYWTDLEISLGAIARLKALEATTPSEDEDEGGLGPPRNWPSEGRIEFKSVTAAYSADSIVLRDISLIIDPGQKVVVCGRTGSGKSSLLLTLLRMLDLRSGAIEVDGFDISGAARSLLRQRCFISVSQDALLFPDETLRFNLDSYGVVSNLVLVEALSRTGLWTHFTRSVDGGSLINEETILGQRVSAFHELSFGQCQLFALSRALVKANELRAMGIRPVVLLDEVTAALDVGTEAVINDIIDDEFTSKGHVVIMVAHRVGIISRYLRPGKDVVLWIRDGRLERIVTATTTTTFDNLGEKEEE
ncbi:putative ABC transporter [Hypoxylon fuscum]|nr:putative ABC transporter [Hypoxylon fuscum]